MRPETTESFALENFEGPLDFLLHLVQKSEINIYDVSIHDLTEQFLSRLKEWAHPSIDTGAEFIGVAASLMWLKSKRLLPKHEQEEDLAEEEDVYFDIIHRLVDYCRFKEIAKTLKTREEQQWGYYPRGAIAPTGDIIQPSLGIEHLKLEDLEKLLQKALDKAAKTTRVVKEEQWRVADKIKLIREMLKDTPRVFLDRLFTPDHSRVELIVTFLAMLELMKEGLVMVMWNDDKTKAIMANYE
jgi:segregation and condensation protein A